MDDLIELKNYIQNKYNINVFINKSKNKHIDYNINHIYINLIIMIMMIILIVYFIYKCKKMKYIHYIFIAIIMLVILFNLQKYIFMIHFYNKNNNKYDKKKIKNYNEINFKTGDILQGVCGWNSRIGFLSYISGLEYLHNLIIINFKNNNYILHYTYGNFGYPKNIISFNDTKLIEISKLDDYLKNDYNVTKYYRLFEINNPLKNDDIFYVLKNFNMKKFKFSYWPCLSNNKLCENKYNCMSFILKILIDLKILNNFNITTFTPNDLIYLPNLSNNLYKNPIIIKH